MRPGPRSAQKKDAPHQRGAWYMPASPFFDKLKQLFIRVDVQLFINIIKMFVQRVLCNKELVAQLAAQHMVADAVDDFTLAFCQACYREHGTGRPALPHEYLPQSVRIKGVGAQAKVAVYYPQHLQFLNGKIFGVLWAV